MSILLYDEKGYTAYITINRPEKRNALNLEVRERLKQAWERVNSNANIRSVIVTGGDEVFSAGMDLHEVIEFRKKEPIKDLPLNDAETFGSMVLGLSQDEYYQTLCDMADEIA